MIVLKMRWLVVAFAACSFVADVYGADETIGENFLDLF